MSFARKPAHIAVWTLVVFGTSCGPRFEPRYQREPHCLEDLDSVPILVVAKLGPERVTPLGRPFRVPSIPYRELVLYKTRMRIETVLKGDVPLGDGTFFYISTNGPVGAKTMGYFGTARVLLLLRREQGKLRTLFDISAACGATVYSGAHPAVRPDPQIPLKQTAVELLLTRGEGATDEGMIRAIFDWAPREISAEYTARNLLRLAESEGRPAARAAACLVFRDVLVESLRGNAKESALSKEFGIGEADVTRWRKQYQQDDTTREWRILTFGAGRSGRYYPHLMPAASTLSGLALCNNDQALGVPQVRDSSR